MLARHITAALELGLSAAEVAAVLKMASYVQGRRGEITADKATHALGELGGVAVAAAVRS